MLIFAIRCDRTKEEKESQPVTQTVKLDSDLIQKLNYFKNTYPHSPYANLDISREQELLRIASSLKQANSESGMESTTALGLALVKLFPNSIKSVNNSQEDYLEQRKVMQQKILGDVDGNRPQRLEELEKKKKEELEEKEKLRAFKEDMYQKPVDEVFIPGSGWVLKSQSELVNGEWKLKSNRKENNTNNNNAPGLDYEATDTLKSMINDHLHVEELKNIGYTQAQINWVNNQKNKNDDPNKMRLNNNNMNETVNQDLNIVQTSPNYWTINGKDVEVVTLMGNTYLSFKNIEGGICGAIAIGIDPREKKNKQIIQKAAKNAGEEFRQLFNQNPLMVPTLDDEIMTELARANNINLKIIENHADEYHSYIDINEYRNGKRIILLSTGEHFTLLVPTRDLNNDLIKLGLAQQDLASKVNQNNYYIKLNEFLNK